MRQSGFDLVIFDCDGVLVDSERLTNTVFARMLNELGLNVTLQDMFETFVGNSMCRCLEIIEDMLGRPVPEEFVGVYKRRCKESLSRDLKPVRGIREAIESLHAPFCVASSGDFEKMRLTLGLTGLLPLFEDRMFSVVQVAQGKPHPDVFLLAAATMGFAPACCAVIEDSPVGVTAGKAAGMTVFGYAEMMPADRLLDAGATFIFEDMAQLPGLLVSSSPNS